MATTRHNLSPNPALKTAATGWSASKSGWSRITNAHGSLPRATAYAGTRGGDVNTVKWPVTPGKFYRATLWIRALDRTTLDTSLNWYDGAKAYLNYSYGDWWDLSAGTTVQLHSGTGKAPAGAAFADMDVTGLAGSAQITAVLVQEFTTKAEADASNGAYFDGDSAGAVWDVGTDGTATEVVNVALRVPMTVAPPVGTLAVKSTRELTIPMLLAPPAGAIGLTAQIGYDDTRGRIRIQVDGLAPDAIRARVSARRAGTRTWAPIRGGKVAVTAGAFTRTVDHYEFAAGAVMEYLVEALSSAEGEADRVAQSRVLTVAPRLEHAWLKFIPAPMSNRKITLGEWDEFEREDRSAVYAVKGRRDPVVITDLHGPRTTTVRIFTETLEERDALDEALGQGAPIFLHTPVTSALPSMYATIGRYRFGRTSKRGTRHMFTVPLTEVAPPPLSIFGAGTTWATLLDRFATWADVVDNYESWRKVAD